VDQKGRALADATDQLGLHNLDARQVLSELWDCAFEHGRLERVGRAAGPVLRVHEIACWPGLAIPAAHCR
jgi:hypothetical protein